MRALIAALAAAALVLAGCGEDDDSPAKVAGQAKAGNASRIVPLNGDIAEIVFALGLADKVVAVDLSAMSLPQARGKPRIGYQRTLSAEGILSQRPTMVIGTSEAGPPPVIRQIKAAGTPVVTVPTGAGSVDTVSGKIRQVATALGVQQRGESLATKVAGEIAAAKSKATKSKPQVAFLYLRGKSRTYQIGGAGSRADAMIQAAGGVDAGTQAGIKGFKPMTAEAMADAKPTVIVTLKSGLDSVGGQQGLLKLPGVAQTPAGRSGKIVAFDDLELLGLGPRTGQALIKLATALS